MVLQLGMQGNNTEGARTFEPPHYVRGIQLLEACIQKLHDEYGAKYEQLEPLVETAIEHGLLWPASGFDEDTALPSSDFKVQCCARCNELGWYSDMVEVRYARVDLGQDNPDGMMGSETTEAYFERMRAQEMTVVVHASTCKLPDDEAVQ
jgi:hypothetical protein